MLKTIRREMVTTKELFTEDGTPRFIEPLGNMGWSAPRMTASEWIDFCFTIPDEIGIYIHARFTMTIEMVPCRTRLNKRMGYRDITGEIHYPVAYDRQITLACPSGCPQWAIYGPFERGEDRAIMRAGEYLVKNHCLVLLDMPEGADVRTWLTQAYTQYQEELHIKLARRSDERTNV